MLFTHNGQLNSVLDCCCLMLQIDYIKLGVVFSIILKLTNASPRPAEHPCPKGHWIVAIVKPE